MNDNKKVENEIFPCEYCGAVFEKSHLHRKHMKNHINETKKEAGARDQREFRCRFCDLPFDKAQALGGHMNRHHDERAKEKIKSVVNMYGINSVQSLMAQMPGANTQGQTPQAIQRPLEANMHSHLANEKLTYPSNTWQPHQPHYAQQQASAELSQQQAIVGFSQQQTTVGFAQHMDPRMLPRPPTYLSAQFGMLERQQIPHSTHNMGGIGPSNRTPYTHAPAGFATHTSNSSTLNALLNITVQQQDNLRGEPGSYYLERENEDRGFPLSSSTSQGYGGFKSKPHGD